MKLPLEGEMTRRHRILFGATVTGLYTLGLATTDVERTDEDCGMDNMGVPHRYEQLRPQDREHLEKFLNYAEERIQSKEKFVEKSTQSSMIAAGINSMMIFAELMAAIKNSVGKSTVVIEFDSNLPTPNVKVLNDYDGDDPRDIISALQKGGVAALPDGSGVMVGKFPLPKDHWIYAPRPEGWDDVRDCSPDLPWPIMPNTAPNIAAITNSLKYAIRGATMNGKDMDFDPDALILNAIQALTGRGVGRSNNNNAAVAEPTGGDPLPPVDDNDHPDAAEN